jgi:preprotein translocase subunit SecY
MKRFIDTIKNIFKIEDLRTRILLTLGYIVIYRLGAHVVLPGINPNDLALLEKQTATGVMSLLDMFSGGAFSNASIFALGIMPYISASIVVQLLGIAVPYFQRLQREGESGRKKMNQITRYLTIGILLLQAPTYVANLHAQLPAEAFVLTGTFFTISSVLILTAGTMFVMWLGEKITDRGIGNGISLIIMIGIIARLPYAFFGEAIIRFEEVGGGLILLLIEIIALFVIFMVSIALVQAVRRIPVQYAKRVVGNKQYGGVRQYIPLKINAAGVMPIIFAQALMFVPMMLAGFGGETMGSFAAAFANYTGFGIICFRSSDYCVYIFLYCCYNESTANG